MSGFGAMDSMRKSYENNRALLGKRKSLKVLYKENSLLKTKKTILKFKTATPNVIRRIREKLKRQKRINLIKSVIVLILSIALVGLAYWYLPIF
jgi:hypothetical protein